MTEEEIKLLEETIKGLKNQKPINDVDVEFLIEQDDILKETQRNSMSKAIKEIKL